MKLDGFKLGIVIPIYERSELTSVVLDYYKRLHIPGLDLFFLLAISPEDSFHDKWKEYGGGNFGTTSIPNKPLSNKWNSAIKSFMATIDLDAISVFGSDDIANSNYIYSGCEQIAMGNYVSGASAFNVYSINDDEMIYWRCRNIGACTFISSYAVKHYFKMIPFPEDRDSGVDMGFRTRCMQVGIDPVKISMIEVSQEAGSNTFVDIKKRGHNINGYNALKAASGKFSQVISAEMYFHTFFNNELYNKIKAIKNG